MGKKKEEKAKVTVLPTAEGGGEPVLWEKRTATPSLLGTWVIASPEEEKDE